ncbi:DNA protecting protein DprA [Secundilactobacillus paracollinoides DSM 15502 = JCM 11969]|nr:DNA protecting protein DprA [Secundilactobacillus paracollinoides DSM 15502 = JCM 11969]
MDKRRLLLRLRLAKGIGIKGETLIYQWLQAHPTGVKRLLPEDMARIANLNPTKAKQFYTSFTSQQLSDVLTRHLNEANWLTILDKHYPAQLKESYLPPNVLFYQGNLALLTAGKLLGVVGAREPNQYAQTAMKRLLPQPIQQNHVIVSGLAKGVDALSHRLAIHAGGHTIGVIGTGLNLTYPAQNRKLQAYMAAHELVLIEYPIGDVGKPHHFVERNRIIAGLTETVLVVQAKQHSGSLITANLAIQNNRNVLAVPGRIDDPPFSRVQRTDPSGR